MRSITPPEYEFYLYLSVYQSIMRTSAQIFFSTNVQKSQQFVRSLGDAQRPPGVKSALLLDPGGLIVFLIN